MSTPDTTLNASPKRLLSIDFHPLSQHVLVTSGADYEVRFWDANRTEPLFQLPKVHKGIITSLSWDAWRGDTIATFSKDKALRLFDPRSSDPVIGEVANDHVGAKGGKALFLGKVGKVLSIGFTRANDREAHIFDPRNLSTKLANVKLDQSSSTPLVFYDDDNSLLFVSGKGDGTIKPYEVVDEDPFLLPLMEYKSKDPAAGLALMHRSATNVMKCEVNRIIKLTPQGLAIPIRFEIPRQNNDWFQEDLFPDSWDGKPTTTAEEWSGGANNGRNVVPVKPPA